MGNEYSGKEGHRFDAQEVLNLLLDISAGKENASIKLPAPEGFEEAPVDSYRFVKGGRGGYYWHEDPSFTTGESPLILDVETDLGRIANEGSIINPGPGNVQVELSSDDTPTWGDPITLKSGRGLDLSGLAVSQIRLTWISDTELQIFAV